MEPEACMLQSPQDLAELLRAAVPVGTDGEANASTMTVAAFVSPVEAAFLVRTVEGRAFRVTITEQGAP